MFVKQPITLTCLLVLTLCWANTSQADIVLDFTPDSGSGPTLGDALVGIDVATASIAVPNAPGLEISVISISSSTNDPATELFTTPSGNRFGINSGGATIGAGDDTDEFDSLFAEMVTFQFNQDVLITEIDFVSFLETETFDFAGISFTGPAGIADVFDLTANPIAIAANTDFSLAATSGSVGFQGLELTVVTAIPEPSALAFGLVGSLAGLVYHRRRRPADGSPTEETKA